MSIISKIPDCSAVLLIGPPLSGKEEFLHQYIKHAMAKSSPLLFISTDKSFDDLKRKMAQDKVFIAKFETAGLVRYIDSCSKQMNEFIKDTTAVKFVSGPLALNEISIALSDMEREFVKKNATHRVIFNSLSTLLTYSKTETIARFLQVIIAKIRKAGGSVIFTLEEGMHDQKAIVTIEHFMDSVIHIKKDGNRILVRADGLPGEERWSEFLGSRSQNMPKI